MKKIVFVTSRFPLPMVGGFETKNFELLKSLSKYYEIDAHFITRNVIDPVHIKSISEFCSRVTIHKPSFSNIILALIKNFFTGRPLQNSLFYCRKAHISIDNSLKSADYAITSVIRTADYIINFKGPKFYDFADSLWQVYQSNLNKIRGIYRLAYFVEWPRLKKFESQLISSAASAFFFNQKETSYYSNHNNVFTVPHGVNPELFCIEALDEKFSNGLTFIGKMDVIHNVNMAVWFIKNVLPSLPEYVMFYIIGANPTPELIRISSSNNRVKILGFIDEPYPALRASFACVCPMQIGGGIQNKILASMACGALTISTSYALSGLNNIESSGVIVCNSPNDWINQISRIIDNRESFEKNKIMSRTYAKKNFSWSAYGDFIVSRIEASSKINL